jgi:hypothetical protein
LNFPFEAPQGGVERFAIIYTYFSQALHLLTVDGFQECRRKRGWKLPSQSFLALYIRSHREASEAGANGLGAVHGAGERPFRGVSRRRSRGKRVTTIQDNDAAPVESMDMSESMDMRKR